MRLLGFLALLVPMMAWAQSYPTKPVHMVIGFPAGGPADIFGRALAHGMAGDLGQPVVVENIPGVGGVLGPRALEQAHNNRSVDIRHDARPFIVHTGPITTTVLGTAFNINAHEKDLTVTVLKGKVKVDNGTGVFSILKRNEQVMIDLVNRRLKKTQVDAKEEIAWELNLGKGVRPMTIEANPDGSTKRVFVQVSELDGVRVIDFAAKKEVGIIENPKLPNHPDFIEHRLDSPSHGLAVSPDQKTLWITSIPQNAAFAYNLADLKLKGQVDLPTINVAGRKPIGSVANWAAFTPDGKQLYISNAANNSVTAIDAVGMKVNAVIPVGQAPKRVGTVVTQ